MVLKQEANLGEDVVGMFMFMTCVMVSVIEAFLVRQLSRLEKRSEPKRISAPAVPRQDELQAAPFRNLPEHLPSVTENTTRTLEYSRDELPR